MVLSPSKRIRADLGYFNNQLVKRKSPLQVDVLNQNSITIPICIIELARGIKISNNAKKRNGASATIAALFLDIETP